MLEADLALRESQKAAQDAERASKAAADEEYRANQYAAEEQYRSDMYNVDSSYAANIAQAEAERKDREYAAQSAERDAKAAADTEYLKNIYATDAEYSAAKAKAEAEAREAKLAAQQAASAGKLEAGLSYAENMIDSGATYFEDTSFDIKTGSETPAEYIDKNGAALGNISEIDQAYQNGNIGKATYQSYYEENTSALIGQAKTADDVEAIEKQITDYAIGGQLSTQQKKNLTEDLYNSVGQVLADGTYKLEMDGLVGGKITLGNESYNIKVGGTAAGKKIQDVLDKVSPGAKEGVLAGFDGNVYTKKNGKWHIVTDVHNEGFVDAYFRYYEMRNNAPASGGGDKTSTSGGIGGNNMMTK
jgi:hypothetical protein